MNDREIVDNMLKQKMKSRNHAKRDIAASKALILKSKQDIQRIDDEINLLKRLDTIIE